MSHVFYKFSSQTTESRITFDGTHISLFDLKREVILANKMGVGGGGGRDFDLGVYDNMTGEELTSDTHQIPRSTSLLLRRLPPANGPGRGNAQRYILNAADAGDGVDRRVEKGSRGEMAARREGRGGGMGAWGMGGRRGNLTMRFDGKEDVKPEESQPEQQPSHSTGDANEDARMAAILQEQDHQWDLQRETLMTQNRVAFEPRGRGRGGGGGGGGHRGGAPHAQAYHPIVEHSGPPPQGYICYRCGQKGHWIQECPTNENPDWENKPRFKRTTGIPRSFLKTVEQPQGGEGSSAGVMVTADGSFVMVQPDTQTWKKHTKVRALTEADIRDAAPTDSALSCPIDSKLVKDAVKTPCCSTTYCEECIHTHLLEHDFVCPSCESKIGSLDKLKPDEEVRRKVEEYVSGEVEKNKEASGGAEEEKGTTEKGKEKEKGKEDGEQPAGSEKAGSKSPLAKATSTEPIDNASANASTQAPSGNDSPSAQAMMDMQNFNFNPMMQMQAMQMQLANIMMTLQSPQLTPQNRMQLSMQAQMLNQNLQQMQMLATSTMGMNGMNGMGMNGMGMMNGVQSQGQAQNMNMGGSSPNPGMAHGFQSNMLPNGQIPQQNMNGRGGFQPQPQRPMRGAGQQFRGAARAAPYARPAVQAGRGGAPVGAPKTGVTPPTGPKNPMARY